MTGYNIDDGSNPLSDEKKKHALELLFTAWASLYANHLTESNGNSVYNICSILYGAQLDVPLLYYFIMNLMREIDNNNIFNVNYLSQGHSDATRLLRAILTGYINLLFI